MKLFNLMASILPKDNVVKVEDIIKTLRYSTETLNETKVNFLRLAQTLKGMPAREVTPVLNLIQNLGFKFNNIEVACTALSEFSKDLEAALLYIVDDINHYDMFTLNNLTPKTAALLAITEDIVALATILSNTVLAIPYIVEGEEVLYKVKLAELTTAMRQTLVITQHFYRSGAIHITKEALSLSDNYDEAKAKDNINIPTLANSITSSSQSIYISKKWWIDVSYTALDRTKAMSSLIQLKIDALDTKVKKGIIDTATSKLIDFGENKLLKIEKKIKNAQ